MAAGEDQAQAVVFEQLALLGDALIWQLGLFVQRLKAALPTQVVDGLEAPGRDQPGARVVRYTALRPLLDRTAKGLMQRLFGQVEIAEQANQGGGDSSRYSRAIRSVTGGDIDMRFSSTNTYVAQYCS